MKKLLKIKTRLLGVLSVTAAISILTSALVISSKTNNKDVNNYKNYLHNNKDENIYLKNLANTFFFNKDLGETFKNDYFFNQNNISSDYLDELNVSLTYSPFSVVNILDKAKEIKIKYARQSIEILNNLLTNNWFWYLNNLDSMLFQFNPFDNKYKDNVNDKGKADKTNVNQFKLLLKENKLFYKISSNNIKGFKFYDLPNLQEDIYTNKKIGFIQISNNSLIPFFAYKNKDENILQITPDLFVFDNNLSDKNITQMFDLFIKLRNERIEEDVKYFKKIKSNNYDETISYKKYNDVSLFQIFNTENYSELFFKEVFQFNKLNKNIKVKRYTWGFNENK
ncbi:aromatic motif membrane protein [Mycoplasma sp. CSL7503-lung]|uniref:aromatic motif membrane protein n=1 Tax=Mycoplasma sp. CSL7503-lung TaxID=536372 RepID=UPI0021D2D15B|nr:aromatic motif membrane protein [Mycoplasma sp. CSL7503-lung]MCU4706699.1 hypothetical protein [Mycoplasma sp. CSL7503-lung]